MLTANEVQEYVHFQRLPKDFLERCYYELQAYKEGLKSCSNCDGVQCMHFVLRDWWADDFDECDGRCCPFCGEVELTYKGGTM